MQIKYQTQWERHINNAIKALLTPPLLYQRIEKNNVKYMNRNWENPIIKVLRLEF